LTKLDVTTRRRTAVTRVHLVPSIRTTNDTGAWVPQWHAKASARGVATVLTVAATIAAAQCVPVLTGVAGCPSTTVHYPKRK
jgi:hypothetical protein